MKCNRAETVSSWGVSTINFMGASGMLGVSAALAGVISALF